MTEEQYAKLLETLERIANALEGQKNNRQLRQKSITTPEIPGTGRNRRIEEIVRALVIELVDESALK